MEGKQVCNLKAKTEVQKKEQEAQNAWVRKVETGLGIFH